MAITGLPAVGADVEISYNGFTFVGPYVDSQLSAHPVYDNTRRIVKHVEYTLRVKAVITKDYTAGTEGGTVPGSITDTAAFRIRANDGDSSPATVRDRLLQAGGQLKYKGQGVGQITVNTSVSDSDVDWGPKPQQCSMKKLGGALVYEVDWVVTFCLPECRGVRSSLGNLRAFSYSVSYLTDEGGFATRTISGELEIALNRNPAGSGVPQNTIQALTENNVDEWLDSISVDNLLRFQRMSTHRTISADKSTLQFSIVDKEHHSPNALPIGVVQADVSHTISSQFQETAFMRVDHHIAGSITVAGTYTSRHAWSRALLIVKSRMRAIVSSGIWTPILLAIQVTEQLFGRGVQFSVSFYCTTSPSNPKDVNFTASEALQRDLSKSGLFAPLETTWEAWRDSLKEKAWSLRGRAGIKHNVRTSGRIYSLCDGSSKASLQTDLLIRDTVEDSRYPIEDGSSYGCDCPPVTASLLDFKNEIKITYDNGVVKVVPLGSANEEKPVSQAPKDNSQKLPTAGMTIRTAKNEVVAVQGSATTWSAEVSGHSVSVCHDPPIPSLYEVRTVDGQVIRLTYAETEGEVIREDNYATLGDGVPVHRKRWKFKLIPVRSKGLPNASGTISSAALTTAATTNIKNAALGMGNAAQVVGKGFSVK